MNKTQLESITCRWQNLKTPVERTPDETKALLGYAMTDIQALLQYTSQLKEELAEIQLLVQQPGSLRVPAEQEILKRVQRVLNT